MPGDTLAVAVKAATRLQPAQFGLGGFLEFAALMMPLLALGALVLIGCWILVKWVLPRLLRGNPSPVRRIGFAIPLLVAATFMIAAFLQIPRVYWGYFGYLVVLSGMIEGGVLVQRFLKILSYIPDSVRSSVPGLSSQAGSDGNRPRPDGGRDRNRARIGSDGQDRGRNKARIGGDGQDRGRNKARIGGDGQDRSHDRNRDGDGDGDGWRQSLKRRVDRLVGLLSNSNRLTRMDRWLDRKVGIGLKKVCKELAGRLLKFWYKRKVKRTGTVLAIVAAILMYYVVKPHVESTFRLAELVLTTFTAIGTVNILIWKLTKLSVADSPEVRMDTLPVVAALVIVISTFTVRLPDTYLPGADRAEQFLAQYVSYAGRLVEAFLTIPLVDFGVMFVHFVGLLIGAGIAVYVHRREKAGQGV
jgi:hypothetical protein